MGISYKEMCEFIAKAEILQSKDTEKFYTAEEIFNLTPDGELFRITEWFLEAVKWRTLLGRLTEEDRGVIIRFFSKKEGE